MVNQHGNLIGFIQMCIRDRPYDDQVDRRNNTPVSYTHLDVYKRQHLDSAPVTFERWMCPALQGLT